MTPIFKYPKNHQDKHQKIKNNIKQSKIKQFKDIIFFYWLSVSLSAIPVLIFDVGNVPANLGVATICS